jgi:hypothetical protein
MTNVPNVANLMPTDIVGEVAAVLRQAARGENNHPNFLTAYQILDRLPPAIRDRLIRERGTGGQNSGWPYAAPTLVAQAAQKVPGVVIDYIDNRGISVEVAGRVVKGGFEVCGIFRLPV